MLNTQKLTRNQISELALLYESGRTLLELAAQYGVKHQTVSYHLKKQGVRLRTKSEGRRKHTLNESAFDSISEESTYWIGFLMADGNVYEAKKGSPRIKLELARRDLAHLERFKAFLGASNPIHSYTGKDSKHFNVILTVSSVKLAVSLARYGVTPRKSFTAKAIGVERNKDFWRGMVDGDGCISATRRRFELIGSKASMEQFAAFVEATTGGHKPKVKPCRNIFKVEVWGNDAVQVLKVLYSDCTIALPRKLDRAKSILGILELGDRIRQKRQIKNLSLTQAALEAGTGAATLSRLENGIGLPYGSTLARIDSWLEAA